MSMSMSMMSTSTIQLLAGSMRQGALFKAARTSALLGSATRQTRALYQLAGTTTTTNGTGKLSRNGCGDQTSRRASQRCASVRKGPRLAAHGSVPYSTEAHAAPGPHEPTIHSLFEEKTGTWQYLVADSSTGKAVIIDSVLDYDPATHHITTQTADALLSLAANKGYQIDKILETHAHADHLTAASYLQRKIAAKQKHSPPICIGKRITQVQNLFGERYGVSTNEYEGVFNKLLEDNEVFKIGDLNAMAIHLPGHTPDHLGYVIGDNVFCGDSLFHPDIGTARCDFPGGNARHLYESARKLLNLPDHVKIWAGHDYPPAGRTEPVPWVSVRYHKQHNKHLSGDITEEDFLALRRKRDAELAAPRLLHPSLQVNIRAGKLPTPTPFGHRLLHLPLVTKGKEW